MELLCGKAAQETRTGKSGRGETVRRHDHHAQETRAQEKTVKEVIDIELNKKAEAEQTPYPRQSCRAGVRPLVLSAFMGAISAVLMAMEFPVPLAPGFVKMDFSDLPVILGGYIMGPLAGLRIIVVKIGLSFLLKGTVTMGVGELANMIGSVSYMLPAVLLYRRWHTRRGAALSLTAATVCAAAAALLYNLFLIFPVYARLYGMSMDSIVAMASATSPWVTDLFTMMLFSMLPFNLFKYACVSGIAFLVYKRLSRILRDRLR